ncbi:MAG TPA: PQQ-binding-like beta-propeller repeat protein [bacterium]|nr:PQQ-binding-like beta-propeller repeat protein [bacterium]
MKRFLYITLSFFLVMISLIAIPGVSENNLSREFEAGWELVSFPLMMDGENLCEAMPSATAVSIDEGEYEVCDADSEILIEAGRGYWIYLKEEISVPFTSTYRVTTEGVRVQLKKGWNLIGSPSSLGVEWNDDILIDGAELSKSSKVNRLLLKYDAVNRKYVVSDSMEPWEGYAMYAYEPCVLEFSELELGDLSARTVAREEIVIDQETGKPVVKDQVLVEIAQGVTEEALKSLVSSFGGTIAGRNAYLGIYQVLLPEGTDIETVTELLKTGNTVKSVAKHAVLKSSDLIPLDPPYEEGADSLQKQPFYRIKANKIWGAYSFDYDPVVAVVDSGVSAESEDLSGRLVAGVTYVGEDNPATVDDNGHGTHVAGIIAAIPNNFKGIAGVCWNCRIMPVKVCDSEGNCPFYGVMNGITYAARNGADVINLSIEGEAEPGSDEWEIFQNVIDYAAEKNVFVAAAAGNSAKNAVNTIPAALDGVFAVGSIAADDSRSVFSNFGDSVDIAAPGEDVFSLEPGGATGYREGTSAAAAFVSGAAALFKSLIPGITPQEIENKLKSGADEVAGLDTGAGVLNLESAFAEYESSNVAPVILNIQAIPYTVYPGGSADVIAKVVDPNGDAIEYDWECSGGTLNSVSDGRVLWGSPEKRGEYIISLGAGDGKGAVATASVSIVSGLDDMITMSLKPTGKYVHVGDIVTLEVVGEFMDAFFRPVQAVWEMNSPHGVITWGGEFTALSPGDALITAHAGEHTGNYVIHVLEAGEEPPALTLSNFAAPNPPGTNIYLGDLSGEQIVMGDVDNDGYNDVIIGENGSQNLVYLNNGDGTFAAAITLSQSCQTKNMDLADIDADGNLDLAEACFANGGVNVYLGNGNGTFTYDANYCAGCSASAVNLADMNNNLRYDMVVGVSNNGQSNRIFYGNGDGTFNAVGDAVGSALDTWALKTGYFDDDDYLDFVEANYNDLAKLYVYNTTTETYDLEWQSAANLFPYTLEVAEIRGYNSGECEGDWDFIVVYHAGGSRFIIYRVRASDLNITSFGLADSGTEPEFYNIAVGDLSNDNMPDVLLMTNDAEPGQMWGHDALSAPGWCGSNVKKLTFNPTIQNGQGVSIGDLDGNGGADFVIAGPEPAQNDVWISDAGANQVPDEPGSIQCSIVHSVLGADPEATLILEWERGNDFEAQESAGSYTYDGCIGTAQNSCDLWQPVSKSGYGNFLRPSISAGRHRLEFPMSNDSDTVDLFQPIYFNLRTVDIAYNRSDWAVLMTAMEYCNHEPEFQTDPYYTPPFVVNNGVTPTLLQTEIIDLNGQSEVTSVKVNLSNIGVGVPLDLADDATHGDGVASNWIYGSSTNAGSGEEITAPTTTGANTYTTTVTITDAAGATESRNASLRVVEWPGYNCQNNWPMFMCNGRNDGEDIDPLDMFPFARNWEKTLPQTTGATPVTWDGKVFIGLSDGSVRAYSTTGADVWLTNPQPVAGAAISAPGAAGNVYPLGTDMVIFVSEDSKMYARNAGDGSSEWTYNGSAPFMTPPIITLTQIEDENYTLVYAVDQDATVHAVRQSDGVAAWTKSVDSGAAEIISQPPIIYKGIIMIVDDDGMLYAMSAVDGAYLWKSQHADMGAPVGGLSAQEDIVVAIDAGAVFAYSIYDGSFQWKFDNPNGNSFTTTPILRYDGADYYLYSADDQGYLNKYITPTITTKYVQVTDTQPVEGMVYLNDIIYAGTGTAAGGNVYMIGTGGDMGVGIFTDDPCTGGADGITGMFAMGDERMIVTCGQNRKLIAYKQPQGACEVNSELDDGGGGTLRYCIEQANLDPSSSGYITFSADMAGKTIYPESEFPELRGDGISINGITDVSGNPTVTVDGSLCVPNPPGCNGFIIDEVDATIRSLAVVNFDSADCDQDGDLAADGCAAIAIYGDVGMEASATNNFIGITAAGVVTPNYFGVYVGNFGAGETADIYIGGQGADGNVISGNLDVGVRIEGRARGVKMRGNYIGTDTDGRTCTDGSNQTGNRGGGVEITDSSQSNEIGLNSAGGGLQNERNIISCNGVNGAASSVTPGIYIHGADVDGNLVYGNCIGVCLDASDECRQDCGGNWGPGVTLEDVSINPLTPVRIGYLGGDEYANVISRNEMSGIRIEDSSDVSVRNARIGVPERVNPDTDNYTDLGNKSYGVYITGDSDDNAIEGFFWDPNFATVTIAYNEQGGIYIDDADSDGNTFSYPFIYENDNAGIEPIEIAAGANGGIQRPDNISYTSDASDYHITVTTSPVCPTNCTITVYKASDATLATPVDQDASGYGEGLYPVGYDTTDAGGEVTVDVPVALLNDGDWITAIVTDASGNSSMFAGNIQVGSGSTCPVVSVGGDAGDPSDLRACITQANTDNDTTITFSIADGTTIDLASELPLTGSNIFLNGEDKEILISCNSGNFNALNITSASATVQGLGFIECNNADKAGIYVNGGGSGGGWVNLYGNTIGTDFADSSNLYNYYGVYIAPNTSKVRVGEAPSPGCNTRNIISNNKKSGVFIDQNGGTGSELHVYCNYIGVQSDGSTHFPNATDNDAGEGGIKLAGNFQNPASGIYNNVIGGHDEIGQCGICITDDAPGPAGIAVVSNYIGVDEGGNNISNYYGVLIEASSGSPYYYLNEVAYNNQGGFVIGSAAGAVSGNYLRENNIHENGGSGVLIRNTATSNEVYRNTIRDNDLYGISVENNADENKFSENSIYNNVSRGISLGATTNDQIEPPLFISVQESGVNYDLVVDTSDCTTASCDVELFCADDDTSSVFPDFPGGEGYTFITSTGMLAKSEALAINGVALAGACANAKWFTATITDSNDNTSEFAVNAHIPETAPGECGTDWPSLHCNENNVGESDNSIDPNFVKVWSFDTSTYLIEGGPVVVDGKVMFGGYDSSGNGVVIGLDTSGAEQWRYDSSGNMKTVNTTPAVTDNDILVVGDWDGYYYGINIADGSEAWSRVKISSAIDVRSDPVVASVNGSRMGFIGSTLATAQGKVVGFTSDDGTVQWQYTTNSSIKGGILYANGKVLALDASGSLYAIAADRGKLLWELDLDASTGSTPAVVDEMVYFGAEDGGTTYLYCVSEHSGKVLWQYSVGLSTAATINSGPAVVDGMVYFGTTGGVFYAIKADGTSMAPEWQYPAVGTAGNMAKSSSAVFGSGAGQKVVFGNQQGGGGRVIILNTSDGSEVMNSTIAGVVDSSPAVAGDMIFIGAKDKKMYAYAHTECPVVSTAGDTGDFSSLRMCINYANDNPGTTITFDNSIANGTVDPVSTPAGYGPLPEITADGTIIDGGTQNITIDGTACTDCDGLTVGADTVTIQSLKIVGFSGAGKSAVLVDGGDSATISDNEIGTNAKPNDIGITLDNGAQDAIIGGAGVANTITYNNGDGIYMTDATTVRNKLSQNVIYENGGLGIELDNNANGDITSLVITSGYKDGANYKFSFDLMTAPPAGACSVAVPCSMEIFNVDETVMSINEDASGAGEAYQYVTVYTVTECAAFPCQDKIEVTVPEASLNANSTLITATLTDNIDNTSEFSDNYDYGPKSPVVTDIQFSVDPVPPDGATTFTITADVTDPNGLADIAGVEVDLSNIGGGTVVMLDDGLSGDGAAGDGKYGVTGITVPVGISSGAKDIIVTATDNTPLTGDRTEQINVSNEAPEVTDIQFSVDPVPPDGATTFTITADVTDPNGLADIAGVEVDLSNIGGGTVVMLDDGLSGDGAAGDGKYGVTGITVPVGTDAGAYDITVTATDSVPQTGDRTEPVNVSNEAPEVTDIQFSVDPITPDGATTFIITADVTDPNGLDDITGVEVDLSNIGGGTVVMLDDGLSGDGAAGDGKYGVTGITVPIGTPPGLTDITVTATDSAPQTGDRTEQITVLGSSPEVTDIQFSVDPVPPDGTTTFVITADVTDPNGLADIASVEIDLSNIGGGTVAMLDDGLSGDGAAGDGKYGVTGITVPQGTDAGAYDVTVTATDSGSLTGDRTEPVNVSNEPPEVTDIQFSSNPVPPDGATTFNITADVTDPNGLDDVTGVEVDLSNIGGGTVVMLDDGSSGDGAAGDGKYGVTGITVPQGTSAGNKDITVTATDSLPQTGDRTEQISVSNTPPVVSLVDFDPDWIDDAGTITTTVYATVQDDNGLADISMVSIDLDSIDTGTVLTLFDDATNGDLVAGDGIFTNSAVVAGAGVTCGTQPLEVTAVDLGTNTGTGQGDLFIDGAPDIQTITFDPQPISPGGATVFEMTVVIQDCNGWDDVNTVDADFASLGGGVVALGYDSDDGGNTVTFKAAGLTVPANPIGNYPVEVTARDLSGLDDTQSEDLVINDTLPKPPVITDGVSNGVNITITFTAPTVNTDNTPLVNLQSHNIYRKDGAAGAYAQIDNVLNNVPGATVVYDDPGPFTDYETYCYKATSINDMSSESLQSNEYCVIALPAPYNFAQVCAQTDPNEYYPPSSPFYLNRPIDSEYDTGTAYLYVADTSNHRINVFDPSNPCTWVKTLGEFGYEPGQFKLPSGLTMVGGNIYVADEYRVQAIDTDGNPIADKLWEVSQAYGIASDGSNIYVTSLADRIHKFDLDGNEETTGNWPLSFADPQGIEYDGSGSLYVVSGSRDEIVILDTDGNETGTIAEAGSSYGQLSNPKGISIDQANSLVYVSDIQQDRVQVFDTGGNLINTIGQYGASPGDVRDPMGISVMPDGTVFIVDYLNNRVNGYTIP